MPTLYDICRCAFRFIKFQDIRIQNFFENSTLLVAKTCLFSQEILNHFGLDEIAALSLIMVLKIVEKMNSGENIETFAKIIVKKFKLEKRSLVEKL